MTAVLVIMSELRERERERERERDESKEVNKELSTGSNTKFKFQVQFDPSKILVMHNSISNNRRRKLHMHFTAVFACVSWAGRKVFWNVFV